MTWNIEIAGTKAQVLSALSTETIPQQAKDHVAKSIDAIKLDGDDLAVQGTFGVLVRAHGIVNDGTFNATYEMRRVKVGPPTITQSQYQAILDARQKAVDVEAAKAAAAAKAK